MNSSLNFNFYISTSVHFGIGESTKLNKILIEEGFKSACIVIDHSLVKNSIVSNIINNLKCKIILIECNISKPTYDFLEEKRIFINEKKIDVFVGLGGGSTLDITKGLAVLYNNNGYAISYRGFNLFKEPIPPIIAIPTTAGTGSEITPNASFIDTIDKRKMGINGEAIRPKYAILDPKLTISCPKTPTISAGVDSMVHATEAFVALKSNPLAKMFAKKGFKLVFENLPSLVENLNNVEKREKVMFGAFLSAVALMNSGTGPAAAMSYPLEVHFGVPHGIGGGIFLPHIIQHNINTGFFDYLQLYNSEDYNQSKEKSANIFISKVLNVWSSLEISQNLTEFGMQKRHIETFISDTIELKLALEQNPVPFYEKEILKILEKLIVN